MRNFDQNSITEAVLERVAAAPDARTKQISEALVRHLHDFVREVRPTQEEWAKGIAFLTDTGQMCTGVRQEFILLSDTLGVSMLVDAINHDHQGAVTESTVLGPFYVEGPPEAALGSDISGDLPGEPMYVSGSVAAADGSPLAGAIVDVWHSDEDGYYDVQHSEDAADLVARARFRTDVQGRFHFWSIKPAAYPIPHDGPVGKMMEQMMRGMRAGGIEMDASGPMRQMMSPEHVEGRIAFLRTELKVTDAQQPLWEVVAEVLRANSIGSKGMMPAMMGGMMQPGASSKPLPQTLADLERMLSSRLDSLRRLNSALEPFYESLDETQKKTADELLMPMGMM